MAWPDLNDTDQRAAYRRELRAVYRGWRFLGLGLVVIGAGLLTWPRMGGPWMLGPWPMQRWGWALLAAGWVVIVGVISARTRYHKRRMAEPPAA